MIDYKDNFQKSVYEHLGAGELKKKTFHKAFLRLIEQLSYKIT